MYYPMGPEDHPSIEKGFEDRPTENEVDDGVYTGQVEDPEDQEKPEIKKAQEKVE